MLRISEGRIRSREELEREAHASLDFGQIATFDALGVAQPEQPGETANEALRLLRDDGLVEGMADGEPLRLTDRGRSQLDSALTRRLSGSGGGILPVTLRISGRVVGTAVSLGITGAFALGLRWVLRFLPAAPVVSGGEPIYSIGTVPLTTTDLWLAGAGALVYCAGRVLRVIGRRKQPFENSRPRIPVPARVAGIVSLLLLTNSWWALLVAVVGATGIVLERLYGSRLEHRRDST
jgi:hypothetical protein